MCGEPIIRWLCEAFARAGRYVITASCTAVALVCLTACAGSPLSLHKVQPETALQWPPRPAEARIEWVKTIADPQDAGITKGFWKKTLEFFIGEDRRRIVRPHGVLFDESERLFIADPGAGVIHFMDTRERRYTVIGEGNDSPLRSPIGLAEDERGHLYITDSVVGTVYRYDLARQALEPFLVGKLQRPTGIAYSRFNRLLYIVDTTAHQIVAVDERGAERMRIGAIADGSAQFNRPTDISIDAKGLVYVTDPLNYRIKVFSPDGKPVSQFGAAGDAPGNMDKPKGVAVDSRGHIYVNDALLDAVQIFDGAGRLLLTFGRAGTGNGELWMPSGIWIDQRDYIFIADTYNRRVQVFRYLQGAGLSQGEAQKPTR